MEYSRSDALAARPDYESMHIELEKMYCELQDEKEKLYHTCGCLERENEKLRAQLEIVHLIFGGNNR